MSSLRRCEEEGNSFGRFFLLIYLICAGNTLQSITEDQYILSSRAHISIDESNQLADFEREAYVNLVIKDAREEAEQKKQQLMAIQAVRKR